MQSSMFPVSVDRAALNIHRDEAGFWHLRVATRVEGELWGGDVWVHYDRLSLGELLDVIQMELTQ